jgi:hypothetical protein
MKLKKKQNLASIQEFGVAAYVKDFSAGKLESCVQVGHFVGYDSKSKGYCIYWPQKRSITVKQNVVFNDKDTLTLDGSVVIPSDVLAEGEKDKVIQAPITDIKCNDIDVISEVQPETIKDNLPNSIPFPSTPDISDSSVLENVEEPPQLGRGHHVMKKPEGTYKRMHNALPPLMANLVELKDDVDDFRIHLPEDSNKYFNQLPPDFALLGNMHTEPRMIDEAL